MNVDRLMEELESAQQFRLEEKQYALKNELHFLAQRNADAAIGLAEAIAIVKKHAEESKNE